MHASPQHLLGCRPDWVAVSKQDVLLLSGRFPVCLGLPHGSCVHRPEARCGVARAAHVREDPLPNSQLSRGAHLARHGGHKRHVRMRCALPS